MDQDYLIFGVEDTTYAVPVAVVERVLRAVAVQPLPQAPELIMGLVNVRGTILPVMDPRRRFNLAVKPLEPSQSLVHIHGAKRELLLIVDTAYGIRALADSDLTEIDKLVDEIDYVRAVVRTEDGMILVCDVETLLSPLEASQLDKAMEATQA